MLHTTAFVKEGQGKLCTDPIVVRVHRKNNWLNQQVNPCKQVRIVINIRNLCMKSRPRIQSKLLLYIHGLSYVHILIQNISIHMFLLLSVYRALYLAFIFYNDIVDTLSVLKCSYITSRFAISQLFLTLTMNSKKIHTV